MTTKLKRRVERLEIDLPARQRAEESVGLTLDFNAEEYRHLHSELYRSMSDPSKDLLLNELSLKHRRRDVLKIAAREDRFRLRPPRAALVPKVRLSPLTLSFIGRLKRALHGDRRPLALPKKVCDIYLWAHYYKQPDIPIRECEACGYDTPLPPKLTFDRAFSLWSDPVRAAKYYSHLDLAINSCPLCGGTLALASDRPWSDRNPDKVVDVHVWPDGEVSITS